MSPPPTTSFKSPLPKLPLFPKIPPFPSKPNTKRLHLYKPHCSPSSNPPPNPPKPLTQTLVSLLCTIPDWADAIKERGMQQKRSLYTHDKWLEHRSSLRHLRHLLSSFQSRVILSLIPPVFAFTSVALIIACYNSAVESDFLPEFFLVLRTSSLPYQLTAPALALLLVFRTEASYSRYEEGRKAWTKIVSGVNDFSTQVIGTVDSSTDAVLKNALLQYIIAFPIALKCHVTYGSDIDRDLRNLLEIEDLSMILNSGHRPRCIIEFISQSLQLLNLDESKRQLLESKISSMHEGIGVCEQLMGIPIPLSYTRLTSRFLVLWHLTLPIILWDDCHWIVVPATFVSAASLFCIEEVGVLIEEPFPMLALDELCDLVKSNIREAVASEKAIQNQLIAKRQRHVCEHLSNGRPSSKLDSKLKT
ncbi:voltage-dependent chloride channel 1, chloroplastic-like [Mercurialis annua]|uniref:voltage-dependent chloride channel 1, chloroplastic-like n=1 Tax=Mercurialis annua TaxID=3986 RepID=UPI00215F2522|nr:voltage-dependent chloride channel 1, chloroplastic-like [Mercurialis annua]